MFMPACPVLRDTAEGKAGSSHVLPTWRGVAHQPSNTLSCPQESLLLYQRSSHSSCLGAAGFLHPCAAQGSILDALPRKPQDSGRGGGEGRRAGTLHEQPLPCATPQWLFLCPAPSRQPSPSSPVHSRGAVLADLPREHSVCLGDMWPELTSLQTVSK